MLNQYTYTTGVLPYYAVTSVELLMGEYGVTAVRIPAILNWDFIHFL